MRFFILDYWIIFLFWNFIVCIQQETPQVTLHQTSWREAVLKELAICSKTFTPEDPPWVAVLAVPPNSCSACKDPVSLACTRGGDIALLETLAAAGSQIGNENEENNRIKTLLEEQRETLRLAMMIPTVSKFSIFIGFYIYHRLFEDLAKWDGLFRILGMKFQIWFRQFIFTIHVFI